MSDESRALIFAALVTVAALSIVIGGAMYMSSATCSSQARAMRLNYEWGALQGCIVEYKGERIPIGAIGVRTINDSNR